MTNRRWVTQIAKKIGPTKIENLLSGSKVRIAANIFLTLLISILLAALIVIFFR